jgi:hypothetical protein
VSPRFFLFSLPHLSPTYLIFRSPFLSPQNDRELSALSVRELKAAAWILEVDIAGCFEKDEIVKAFKRANVSSDQARAKG